MTEGVATSTNTKLQDPGSARSIVEAASSALDALQRAGVALNPVEVAFAQALDWNKLKAQLLAAYDSGKTPQVRVAEGAPGVGDPTPDDDIVWITLSGVVRPGGI